MSGGRERRSVHVDRRTGEITVTAELLPAASFEPRAEALIAAAMLALAGGGPIEAKSLALRCDGCGTTVEIDFDHPQVPEGWTEREDGDFCPECSA